MSVHMITITQEEYNSLQEDSWFLTCLKNCGVDNWSGYDWAVKMRDEDIEE